MDEVVSPSEEVPRVVKLDPRQLGEVALFILGTEDVVDGGCPEDYSHANDTSNEVVALSGDGAQDGGLENGHEVGKAGRVKGMWE